MATTWGYPGSYSGFIPSWEATGMLIDYTRDPTTFAINEYAQYVETDKPIGVYAVLDADQPARVVTDDDFTWPDGAEAPAGNDNLLPFVFLNFRCVRKNYPFTLGDETVANTSFQVLAAHAGMAQQQCMTGRILQTYLLLNGQVTADGVPTSAVAANPTTVWGSNTGTCQALVPGISGWYAATDDEASPNFLAIKRSLLAAFRNINLLTNGKVQRRDLRLVLGPDDAQNIANTAEIQNFLKNNQYALAQVKGNEPGQNALWGLPDYYAGFKIVVDDTTRVTIRPLSTATTTTGLSYATPPSQRQYVWQPGSVGIMSRPGGLSGEYGKPSFSTLQLYFYREMEVQSFDDRRNERTEGRVVESRAPVLAAPAAGYWITGVNTK